MADLMGKNLVVHSAELKVDYLAVQKAVVLAEMTAEKWVELKAV